MVTGKMAMLHPFLHGVEGMTQGTNLPHLCARDDHGADPPGSCAKPHGRQVGDTGEPAVLHHGQVLHGQPSSLL